MGEAIDAALIDVLNEKLGFLKWGFEDMQGRLRNVRVDSLCNETQWFLDGNLVMRSWNWWEGGEMGWKVVRV